VADHLWFVTRIREEEEDYCYLLVQLWVCEYYMYTVSQKKRANFGKLNFCQTWTGFDNFG